VHFRNVIVLISLLAIGVGTAACGGSSPSAPTQLSGPASSSTTTTNGATINGSITGAALAALSLDGPSGFASASGPALIVTVVGTTITAQVNPNGTFVLTNVPPGDIQLQFTGPGTNALLTVSGVNGGDELRITVQVSGNTATLQDVSRKDKINKIEIEGPVISGACASFVVNGTTITTDAATNFSKGTCASVVPGAIVQVKGSTLADGTVRATDVKFKTDDDDDDDEDNTKIELEGLVTSGACGLFTVKNVLVTTDAATVFKNGRCDEIAIGARVHVRGTPTAPGAALATLVNIQRDADDNGKSGDKENGGGGNENGKGKN
jgi:hypothetical protein